MNVRLFRFAFVTSVAICFSHTSLAQRPWPQSEGKVLVFYDQLSTHLTDAQNRFVATRACGTQKVPRSFINRLRVYNPNFLLLHYELAFGAGNIANLEGESWIFDWSSVNPHENWFLHDCSNRRCHQTDWDWDFMDPSGQISGAVPGWKEYWADRAIKRMRLNDCDGTFADSHHMPWNMNYYPCNFEPPARDVLLGAHFNLFDAYQMQRFHTDTTKFKYIPNLGQLITTRDTSSNLNIDGAMFEIFGTSSCDNHFDPGDWTLEVDRVLRLARQGKILIFQNDVDYNSPVCRLWLVASYFMMKNATSYLNLLIDGCGDGIPNWLAEYDINLGAFVGGVPASAQAMFDATSGLYRRAYEKGIVLVNNSNAARTMSFPSQRYRVSFSGGGCVRNDGSVTDKVSIAFTPITSISLPAMTAAIVTYSNDTTTTGVHDTPARLPHSQKLTATYCDGALSIQLNGENYTGSVTLYDVLGRIVLVGECVDGRFIVHDVQTGLFIAQAAAGVSALVTIAR